MAPIEYSTEDELKLLINKQEDFETVELIIETLNERFEVDFEEAKKFSLLLNACIFDKNFEAVEKLHDKLVEIEV